MHKLKRKGDIIGLAFGIVCLMYLLVCMINIWCHNANETPLSEANIFVVITRETADMKVVDCMAYDDCYEVVVEDIKGNQWAYYDDTQKEIGTVLRVVFDGDEIVNAKIKREGK